MSAVDWDAWAKRLDAQFDQVDALERRVTEIESRLAEAGRRALFITEDAEALKSWVAANNVLLQLGRALLFDPETPDDRGDETP